MDIKKHDSSPLSVSPTAGSKQTGPKQTAQSHNQSSQQPQQLGLQTTASQQLKIGQQLELIVLKLSGPTALLEIVGTNIQAHTRDKALLQLGQKLKVQISQTQPIIQFKILSSTLSETDNTQALIKQTLRQTLPLQQSLQDLVRSIPLLNKMAADSPLHKIKESFIQSSPPSQAFAEAQVLPQILKRSGLFTENLLANMLKKPAQQASFPNNDLRIALLRLASQLRALQTQTSENTTIPKQAIETSTYSPALLQQNQKNTAATQRPLNQRHSSAKPSAQTPLINQQQLIDRLIILAEGSIAKLQTQQLQQQQLTESQKPAWTFDLPIRTDSSLDSVTIYINKDDSNNKNHYFSPWALVIKLNIEHLGDIQANVSLRGNKISVVFWLDNIQTASLFSDNLQQLEAKLNKVGLESDQIKCHCEKPPHIKTPLQTPSLNEEI